MTWRIGGLLALLAALVAAGWWANASIRQDERAKVIAIYAQQAIEAEQSARAKEQTLNNQILKAVQDAKAREKTLLADAGRARSANDGLRDDLATASHRLSTLSRDAAADYAQRLAGVLTECSAAYSSMAGIADAAISDRRTLIEAWPR